MFSRVNSGSRWPFWVDEVGHIPGGQYMRIVKKCLVGPGVGAFFTMCPMPLFCCLIVAKALSI